MVWIWAAASVVGLMLATWAISLPLRDTSVVDRVWGLGFVLAAAVAAVLGASHRLWVVALVAIWGLRLSWHITRRNLGHGEDARYAAWRAEHGARWPLRSLVTVFGLQGAIMFVVVTPVVAVLATPGRPVWWLDWLGLAVAAGGLLIEVAADWQLRRLHVSGTIMDRGLWRYSRHPNYFGEALIWWGLWIIAVAHGAWWTIISPIVMTGVLRFISVPVLERKMERPGWYEYVQATNAFVIGPRRASAGQDPKP